MTPEEAAVQALDELLKGRLPAPLPEDGQAGLATRINQLGAFMAEIQGFILPLAKGELSSVPLRSGNFMASPFKELHSRLCELTWQAQQVARGDYAQRIDFMGEFSVAFNSMVQALDAKDRELNTTIKRLDKLLSTSLDAVHVIDVQGRLVIWNPAFLKHLGYADSEAPGLNVRDWDAEYTPEALLAEIQALIRQPRTFETLHKRKDGTVVPVEISATGIQLDGQDLLFAAARDVTDRKRAHSLEVRTRKAESLVLMAGSIAHDFNNLFQALLTNLEIVTLKARGIPDVTRSVAEAQGILRRAIGLSWTMLECSGQGLRNAETLDLAALVTQWGREGHPRLDASRLMLACEAVPAVTLDRAGLRKVLDALAENAVEAMAEAGLPEGKVRIRVLPDPGGPPPPSGPQGLWVAEHPGGTGTVCLEFANDGPIPEPGILARMFDPFFTIRALGRGLGLASVLGILNAHKAGLEVVPDPVTGLAFRLHFSPA